MTPRKFWAKHFLWAEFCSSALLTCAIGLWIFAFKGKAVIEPLLEGNRAVVYGTIATISGSLLGFVITAASVVLGFSTSDRLAIVRNSKHYPTLWKVFTASMRALAFATIIAFIGLLLDRDKRPVYALFLIVCFSTLLATVRILRSLWIMENIINLLVAPTPKAKGDSS